MTRVVLLLAMAVGTSMSVAAQPGCYDTGHSLRCRAGCRPLTLPRFPGDGFSWRCSRPTLPPPPRYHSAPPPPQESCPSGMYAATDTWCCPFGSVYRNGNCRFPQEQRTYQASGSEDPTPLYILGVIGLIALLWYDHHLRQIAWARETDDDIDSTPDIEAARTRMDEAAREADEIIARYRDAMRPHDREGADE